CEIQPTDPHRRTAWAFRLLRGPRRAEKPCHQETEPAHGGRQKEKTRLIFFQVLLQRAACIKRPFLRYGIQAAPHLLGPQIPLPSIRRRRMKGSTVSLDKIPVGKQPP